MANSDDFEISHTLADGPVPSSYMTPPQKKKRKLDDPDQRVKKMAKLLTVCVPHDDDDDDNNDDDPEVLSLEVIWGAVNGFRKGDKRCATFEGFQKNVERMGEHVFAKWLKDVIKKESWGEILLHGTFYFLSFFTF